MPAKKKIYRKKKSKTTNMRIQKSLTVGFPKTNMIKLRYVTTIGLNPAPGTIATHNFRANSCFDPDQSAIGHQPIGFDEWSTFYNHYVVQSAKMRATFSLTSTTDGGGLGVCGIYLSDDTTYTADLHTLLEQPNARNGKTYFSIHAGKPLTVSKTYSAKSFFNITNVTDNFDRLGAPITTNPTEVAFFVPFCANANYAIDAGEMTVLIELEQTVIFSEPKELAQS